MCHQNYILFGDDKTFIGVIGHQLVNLQSIDLVTDLPCIMYNAMVFHLLGRKPSKVKETFKIRTHSIKHPSTWPVQNLQIELSHSEVAAQKRGQGLGKDSISDLGGNFINSSGGSCQQS